MKKSVAFLIAFLAIQILQAQNYIPLKIDSLYGYYWELGFEFDTITGEYYSGFTYDTNDSLVQRRSEGTRINYAYDADTAFILVETTVNNTWSPNSRSKTVFSGGKEVSKLIENYSDNTWINGVKYTNSYNSAQQHIQQLQQLWSNNAWVNFYKKESIYNPAGQKTEEAEYYTNNNGDWEYNRGQRYQYDNAGHQTELIYINSSVNGPYFTSRFNWSYGNDNLVDTIQNCHYNYPDNGVCNPVFLTAYNYSMPGNTEIKTFLREDNNWSLKGKEVEFEGPGIYSGLPDSILYFSFLPSTQTYKLSDRRYFHYQELPNGTIYFKEEKRTDYGIGGGWILTSLREEWYHLANTVGVKQPSDKDKNVDIFPNPCSPGTPLNISAGNFDEILIFDELGRLVASQTDTSFGLIQAPMKQGVYTLVLMKDVKLVGRAKQVVME